MSNSVVGSVIYFDKCDFAQKNVVNQERVVELFDRKENLLPKSVVVMYFAFKCVF